MYCTVGRIWWDDAKFAPTAYCSTSFFKFYVDLQAIITVLFCYWNSTLKRNLFVPRSSNAIYDQTKRLYELHQSRIQIVSSVLPIPQQQWKCDGSKVKANPLHVTPVVLHSERTYPTVLFLIDAGTSLQRLTLVMKRQWKEGKKIW